MPCKRAFGGEEAQEEQEHEHEQEEEKKVVAVLVEENQTASSSSSPSLKKRPHVSVTLWTSISKVTQVAVFHMRAPLLIHGAQKNRGTYIFCRPFVAGTYKSWDVQAVEVSFTERKTLEG